MAEKTGKAARTIRKAAELNQGIGKKVGRDWVLTDADIAKIKAVTGTARVRTRRAAPSPAPATPQEGEGA